MATYKALRRNGAGYAQIGAGDQMVGDAGALTVQSGTPASPAVRTIPAAIFRRHDIRDYNGCDLTGANDCASIVQAAFNASKTAGKVWVPGGDIALGSSINLATGGCITGDGTRVTSGNNPDGSGGYGLGERGPTFVLGHSGPGFYSPRGVNSNLDGQYNQVVLESFTTRRIQPSFDVAGDWSPNNNHDFDFILTDRTRLRDIHILNATRGVKVGNSVYGYVDLYNVTGLAATEWLSVNESPNFLRFRNVACFCDWVINNNAYFLKYKKWSLNNLVAYRLGRCDELIMSNCTASFAKNGMIIQNNVANNGSVAGGIHDLLMDTCVYPLTIQGNGANVAFTGRTGLGSVLSDGGNQIPNGVNFAVGAPNQIKGSLNRVTIDNFDAGFSQTTLLDSKGEQNDVHVKAAKIIDWDRAKAGTGAFVNNDTGSGPLYVDSVFPMRRTEDNGKKIYGTRTLTVSRAQGQT